MIDRTKPQPFVFVVYVAGKQVGCIIADLRYHYPPVAEGAEAKATNTRPNVFFRAMGITAPVVCRPRHRRQRPSWGRLDSHQKRILAVGPGSRAIEACELVLP
jgi:hypothetical protein